MRSERNEAFEARIVVVSTFVQAARKQVSTLTEIKVLGDMPQKI
jgi:hypothetical protein